MTRKTPLLYGSFSPNDAARMCEQEDDMRPLLLTSLVSLIMLCLCSYVLGQSEQGYVTIYLKDEGILTGRVVASDETTITIESIKDGEVIVYRSSVKEIKQEMPSSTYNDEGRIINDVKGKKPTLHGGRIFGEVVGGSVVGIAGLFGGIIIGDSLWPAEYNGWFYFPSGEAIIFALSLSLFGSSIVVYLVGNEGDETGSFLATSLGGVLGFAAGIAIAFITPEELIPVIGILVGPSIGATIGFNMTRRYKEESTMNSEPRIPLLQGSF